MKVVTPKKSCSWFADYDSRRRTIVKFYEILYDQLNVEYSQYDIEDFTNHIEHCSLCRVKWEQYFEYRKLMNEIKEKYPELEDNEKILKNKFEKFKILNKQKQLEKEINDDVINKAKYTSKHLLLRIFNDNDFYLKNESLEQVRRIVGLRKFGDVIDMIALMFVFGKLSAEDIVGK